MRSRLARLPKLEFGFSSPLLDDGSGCYPLSCGVTCLNKDQNYYWDNRCRDSFGLVQYTIAGEGVFEDENGSEHRLTPGRAFVVLAPESTRYWRIPRQDWHFIFVLYGGEQAFEQTQRLIQTGGRLPEFSNASAAAHALADMHEMGGGADRYTVSAILYRLLMMLRSGVDRPSDNFSNFPAYILHALQLIEDNFSDASFCSTQLAESCGYSRFHFSRLFRKYCNDSPQQYLISVRLRRAMEMLAAGSGEYSVKKISIDCGFNDFSYFCQMFRRRYGVSPGTLRRY